MMFDLSEEDLKRAAREMSKEAAKEIQERMVEDAMFGERASYGPYGSTRTMNPFTMRPSIPFIPFVPPWTVVTSPYVVEKKKRSREVKRTFWQKLWASLSELNPWPYSPIEYYEVEVPAIVINRPKNQIICHPSLEREIKRAVDGGHL